MPRGNMQPKQIPGFTDPADRTPEQELQSLGVIEKPPTVEGIKWTKPHGARKDSALVNLGKSGLFLPSFVTDDLGPRIMIGTGKFKGKLVLLLKSDVKGYLHYGQKRGRKRCIASSGLKEMLTRAGAQFGYYEPVKITGGWMCERVEK